MSMSSAESYANSAGTMGNNSSGNGPFPAWAIVATVATLGLIWFFRRKKGKK